mmetsp:Transcript_4366/g.5798  ORF Transcript_4366/g.5798 Transcript_4366/m.5798 type:complete len:97 (-) Transcript_4366:276-566(-)
MNTSDETRDGGKKDTTAVGDRHEEEMIITAATVAEARIGEEEEDGKRREKGIIPEGGIGEAVMVLAMIIVAPSVDTNPEATTATKGGDHHEGSDYM